MSYYQGDYYRGGFFSFLGGVAKSFLGLPSGGATARVAAPAQVGPANPLASMRGQVSKYVSGAKALASKHPVLTAAAAAGALAMGGGAAMLGGKKGKAASVAALTGMKKRRRMHVTNIRALRRAIRRTHGFAKVAMKVIHITHPRKKGRFGGFRKKRRAAV